MKLSIGTAQFGFKYGICNKHGIVSKPEIKKIFKFCRKHKIYSIDTAQGYGKSHQVLGTINLNNFLITTKISNIKKININRLEYLVTKRFEKILKDLNTKKLYALLIHDVSEIKGNLGTNFFKIFQNL